MTHEWACCFQGLDEDSGWSSWRSQGSISVEWLMAIKNCLYMAVAVLFKIVSECKSLNQQEWLSLTGCQQDKRNLLLSWRCCLGPVNPLKLQHDLYMCMRRSQLLTNDRGRSITTRYFWSMLYYFWKLNLVRCFCRFGLWSVCYKDACLHHIFVLQLLVAKSPVAPFSTFFYTIEKSGLVLQGKTRALLFCLFN